MFKSVSNKVKQYTLNLSDLELKVEDATSNEVWGPHGTVMSGARWRAGRKDGESGALRRQGQGQHPGPAHTSPPARWRQSAAGRPASQAPYQTCRRAGARFLGHSSPAYATTGPSSPAFSPDIAEAAFDYESYRQIMGVLARRLQEKVRCAVPCWALQSAGSWVLAAAPGCAIQQATYIKHLLAAALRQTHAVLLVDCAVLRCAAALAVVHHTKKPPYLRPPPAAGRELAHVLQGAAAAGVSGEARPHGGWPGGKVKGVGRSGMK